MFFLYVYTTSIPLGRRRINVKTILWAYCEKPYFSPTACFQYQGWEYTGMDQDEEEEDFAAEDDFEEDEEEDPNKKKPFGETAHYCPVLLKERNLLWPGSSETAVKYREKVYFLSSSDAQEQFLEDPESYLPKGKSSDVSIIWVPSLSLWGTKHAATPVDNNQSCFNL